MSSSIDVHTPIPFKINGLWQFFPNDYPREGEPDKPPLGPFIVRGDYKVERKERDIPVQRFLILKPTRECVLPSHTEYVVEYPEKMIAASFVTFEMKGRACRIRAQLSENSICCLPLLNHILPISSYVIYEQQVEGTWIPVEADGEPLKV